MAVVPFNVNVMDAHGLILASGNAARVGELHAGALLALAKKLTTEIDGAAAHKLHGAQPGINLPLCVGGEICGAVQRIGIFQHSDLGLEAVGARQNRVAFFLQGNIVILRHSIEADDEMAVVQQSLCQMKANEASRSGNQISHSIALL